MDRERLDQWCERGIVAFTLGILCFGPLATGGVRPLEFLILQGATVVVGLLWLVRLWLNPSQRLLWPPVCWGVLAFVGYMVWRYLHADLEYVAREELVRVVVYALLFFAILNNLHRQEHVQWVVLVVVFLAMIISVYAGYQFATGSGKVWHFVRPEQYKGRGSGTYICPNHLAGFLEMILPLALAYTLAGRLSHVLRIFVGYASLVILAGIAFSMSRGGWIATGLSLTAFFLVLLRHRDFRWGALASLTVLVGAGVVFVAKTERSQDRFRQMFAGGKLEDMRFRLWKPAVQIWQREPWIGVGPGHFDYHFRTYRTEDVQMRPYRVHNDYLNTLADLGIVGLGLVGASLLLLGWGLLKTRKFAQRSSEFSSRRSNRWAFVVGATVGLLAILLHSAVDFNMHIPANAILAVTLMALLASHIRFATERFWAGGQWILRLTFSAGLGFGLFFLTSQGYVHLRETSALRRALALEEEGKKLVAGLEKANLEAAAVARQHQLIHTNRSQFVAALEKAHEIEPANFETVYRIGESLRTAAWQGEAGYEKVTRQAMDWFTLTMKLNPYDSYGWLRYGMCLHWLGRHDEAKPYFDKAVSLDPNGYYTVAHQGWHFVEMGDFAEAKKWFEKSLRLKPHFKPDDNPIAANYLRIVQRRLTPASQ